MSKGFKGTRGLVKSLERTHQEGGQKSKEGLFLNWE